MFTCCAKPSAIQRVCSSSLLGRRAEPLPFEAYHPEAMRRSVLVSALSLTMVLVPMSPMGPGTAAAAGLCGNGGGDVHLRYAYQVLPHSASNGVDGYVWGTWTALSDPMNTHVIEWVQIGSSASLPQPQWVQIGEAEGCSGLCPGTPCVYFPNQPLHLYAEKTAAGQVPLGNTGSLTLGRCKGLVTTRCTFGTRGRQHRIIATYLPPTSSPSGLSRGARTAPLSRSDTCLRPWATTGRHTR